MFWFQVLPVQGYPPSMVWSHHGGGGTPALVCICAFYSPVYRTLHAKRMMMCVYVDINPGMFLCVYNPEYRTLSSTGGRVRG